MKIHEYQAKQLLRDAGVAVPQGIVAAHAPTKRPPRSSNSAARSPS